ncbi:MAG TPA: single-stranded DNA-binding protein [Candidatus Erysipelatoclostridium merdavium]|uniref:Single-stranded DNA-binding protein n=1 Tax=Candidatus Erysipelatoclostridium merdavium TaxID=2838566 RepID=A0A9D2BPE6_9FIRM|nr:single-stranded DNA-binding protein [Candidatus Erysipelatoclostridium merdavium]
MINRVTLIGRLVRDPDLRRTNDGTMVASFTIAVNRNYTAKDGQQQADFINCVVWRKTAETLEKYCRKGNLIGLDGRLQTRTYENAQGQRVFVTEVVCDNIQFLESKSNNNQNTQNKHNNQGYARNQQTRQNFTSNIDSLQLNNELDDIGAYVLEDDIQF